MRVEKMNNVSSSECPVFKLGWKIPAWCSCCPKHSCLLRPPERYLPPHEKPYGPEKERQATLTFVPQVGTSEKEYEIRKSWRRARECVFQKHVICNCANSDVFVSPIFCFPVVCITLDWNIRCCFCEFLNPILSDDVYECASDGCFPAPFCCLN